MNNVYDYYRWRRLIYILTTTIASVQFIVETTIFHVYIGYDTLDISVYLYMFKNIILPTFVNLTSILIATEYCKLNKQEANRNRAVICMLVVPCITISYVHAVFPETVLTIIIPMIICCIFEEKKLLNIMFYTVLVLAIGPLLLNIYAEHFLFSDIIMHFICIYAIFIVAYIVLCFVSIVEKEKRSIIKTQMDKEHILLESLKRDSLTKLYNNQAIKLHIKNLYDEKVNFKIAMIDIDNFKGINDNYGHSKGDEIILEVSKLLLSLESTGEGKIRASRYGGDEFMVCFVDLDVFDIKAKLDDIEERFKQKVDNITSLSIGISSPTKTFNEGREVAISADEALYKAKDHGKGHVEIDD